MAFHNAFTDVVMETSSKRLTNESHEEQQIIEEVLEGWRHGVYYRHRSAFIDSAMSIRLFTRKAIFCWKEKGSIDAVFILRNPAPLISFLPACDMMVVPNLAWDIHCTGILCSLALTSSNMHLSALINRFVKFFHTLLKEPTNSGPRSYRTKANEIYRPNRNFFQLVRCATTPLIFLCDYDVNGHVLWLMMKDAIMDLANRDDGTIVGRPVVCISISTYDLPVWVDKRAYL